MAPDIPATDTNYVARQEEWRPLSVRHSGGPRQGNTGYDKNRDTTALDSAPDSARAVLVRLSPRVGGHPELPAGWCRVGIGSATDRSAGDPSPAAPAASAGEAGGAVARRPGRADPATVQPAPHTPVVLPRGPASCRPSRLPRPGRVSSVPAAARRAGTSDSRTARSPFPRGNADAHRAHGRSGIDVPVPRCARDAPSQPFAPRLPPRLNYRGRRAASPARRSAGRRSGRANLAGSRVVDGGCTAMGRGLARSPGRRVEADRTGIARGSRSDSAPDLVCQVRGRFSVVGDTGLEPVSDATV